jgi:hypothetical protein
VLTNCHRRLFTWKGNHIKVFQDKEIIVHTTKGITYSRVFVLFDKYIRNVVFATNLLQSVNEADPLRKCFTTEELRYTTGHLYESVHTKVKAQKILIQQITYCTVQERVHTKVKSLHTALTRECSYNRKVIGNYSYIRSLTKCSYNKKVTRNWSYC